MLLQISRYHQILITFDDDNLNEIHSLYRCGASMKYCYLDCFQIKPPNVTLLGNFQFNINATEVVKKGNESMLIDVVSYESKLNTFRNSQGRKETYIGDNHSDNIQQSIRNWLESMSDRNFDPFWVRNCEEEIAQPFDKLNPKLEISLPFLSSRKGFSYGNVDIYAHNKKFVYRGNMENGKVNDPIYVPSGRYLICTDFHLIKLFNLQILFNLIANFYEF